MQHDLGVSFGKLGNVMRQQGNTQDAIEFYRKYQRIAQTLVDADPKNAEAQRDLLVSFMKFGAVAEETSDYATAMTCYEKALAVAVNFERPEFFANEVKVLKTQISKCQAKLPSREAKP